MVPVLGLAGAHVQQVVVLVEDLGHFLGVAGEDFGLESGDAEDDEADLLEDAAHVGHQGEHVQVGSAVQILSVKNKRDIAVFLA